MLKNPAEPLTRFLKQTACALLSAALILCAAPPLPASAADANDGVTSLLSAIGVLTPDDSGSFNLEKSVTRAEFTKMLIAASPWKDSVSVSASSLFKDVPASHWAAPYIKPAVTNALLSGYSDGTFRPDSPVTVEQAANSALKLLGYTADDFRGAFPDAQMNLFRSTGLALGVDGVIGAAITRGSAARILYNLLNTKLKDGSQKYAESLGYKLNAAGELDYAGVLSENMNGPYTAKASWATDLGLSGSSFSVYKNGTAAATADVKTFDILYCNAAKTVVWAYDKKITGVYERATPSQNDVTAVVVAGKEYALESSAAFAALSSAGSLRLGTTITLLLGKGGGVADAVAASSFSETVALYVTETGSKTYTNANDQTYLSTYISGISAGGDVVEYPVSQTWIKKGDVVKISFPNGAMNISRVSGGAVSGLADASLGAIGQTQLAPDARILDVSAGAYTFVSIQRLDGMTISAANVLYNESKNGKLTSLVLNDVTGDSGVYGVITSAKKSGSGTDSDTSDSMSVSSWEYAYLVAGVSRSLSSGSNFGVTAGPARLWLSGDKPELMQNLKRVSGRIKSIGENEILSESPASAWPVFSAVDVYTLPLSGQYAQATLADAAAALAAGKTVDCYYNALPSDGGQIRIILIRQQ
ncbi:MAG: S-layer homology domain-containing protein [Clostridiales Family XIII bacterium]|jgi:hypothetical protein|nr:S-layer homology domain-containing protein [Clostridiales Family XIII bacterium]